MVENPNSLNRAENGGKSTDSLRAQLKRVMGPTYTELLYLPEQIEAEMFYAASVVDTLNAKFAEKFGRVIIKKSPTQGSLHQSFWNPQKPALGFLMKVPQQDANVKESAFILVVKDGRRSRMSLLKEKENGEPFPLQGNPIEIETEDIVESFTELYPQFEEVHFQSPTARADQCHAAVLAVNQNIDQRTEQRRCEIEKSLRESIDTYETEMGSFYSAMRDR